MITTATNKEIPLGDEGGHRQEHPISRSWLSPYTRRHALRLRLERIHRKIAILMPLDRLPCLPYNAFSQKAGRHAM